MSRILVTGVGAVIGYGVLRSLRAANASHHLVGMDIFEDAAGKHWADAFVQAPLTTDPCYPVFVRDVIKMHGVELLIPAIEQDVAFWSQRPHALEPDGRIALNDAALIACAGDKWLMHQRLIELGLPAIPSRIDGDFADLSRQFGSPFLLKPRRGYAGKGIVRIRDARDFAYYGVELGTKLMAQKLVGADADEHTVSGFGDGEGGLGQLLALQRRLSGEGATAKARVVDAAPFAAVIGALGTAFKPIGPTNFQFRTEGGQSLLLEINPRISSATSLRTAFGYNEAQACVDYYLHGRLPALRVFKGGCGVRYIEDIVVHDRDHF